MADTVLSQRALNRALLERQGLLARSRTPPLGLVERLVGMQAQVPENPYVALWSRLEDFRPEALSELIADRRAVRAGLLRATLHLASARDCLTIQPLVAPIFAKVFVSAFLKGLAGADRYQVAAAGRALLAEQPRTRAQLSALLAPRWPEADPANLAYAVSHHAALVQVPPRGLWGASGQSTWAPTETWLGAELDREPSIDALMLRYLAAFGPAATGDARTWSRLTGLRAVLERLRPQLRSFRDERGRELFDVPDGPLPDPDTPAPPRFLPEYDNSLLSHDDRSRILAGLGPGLPFPAGKWKGTLLVDGFYRANWQVVIDADAATLTIDRFNGLRDDPAGARRDIVAEGEGLLAFVAPDATARRIEFAPEP
jgi:hypothetical protein